MLERESNQKAAGRFAWFAARDARQRSLAYSTHFSDAQKVKAERMRLALELVYYCSEVSVTYCKKWIRVKVHKAAIRDRKNLAILEADWGNQGVIKVNTDQGIIYRVV